MSRSFCIPLSLVVIALMLSLFASPNSLLLAVEAAAPPLHHRTKAEVAALHAKREPNGLHNSIRNVVDLNARYFNEYIKPHEMERERRRRYWLVVFYASWCGKACDSIIEPLQDLAALVHAKAENEEEALSGLAAPQKAAKLLRGQISIAKHDVTENEGVSKKYNIDAYPTVLLFDRDDSSKITTFEGERTGKQLLKFLRENTKLPL